MNSLIYVILSVEMLTPRENPTYRVAVTLLGSDLLNSTVLCSESAMASCIFSPISNAGLGLRIPFEAPASSTLCVETAKLLAVGEVRHAAWNRMVFPSASYSGRFSGQ